MGNAGAELGIPDYIKVSKIVGESSALVVTVEPGKAEGYVLTDEALQIVLRENGAQDWYLNQEQVRHLRAVKSPPSAAKSFRIAEPRDAEVRVRVSNDRKQAKITIVHPFGGAAVSAEKVFEVLKTAGVTHGILEWEIPRLVESGACENVLIAEATPPNPGTDAVIEQLIHDSDHKGRPREGEHGKVDHHDLELFVSVAKGTPLLRRIPPTPGTPGIAVDGSPIPPKNGKERNLSPGPGIVLSPEDPNLLIAAVDGQPIFSDTSAKIVGRLDVDGVDYHTGDIRFDGSVHVAGPISPGFKVFAGGNIVALDTVDASNLTAGGSIQLRCGVIGRGRCQIQAKGSVKAKFLNECFVSCGGNLEVEDLIANCTVVCEGKIEVGQHGGKGQIYGGKAVATKEIRAKILGAVTERETFLEISPSPSLTAQERKIKKGLREIASKYNEIGLSLTYLKNSSRRQNDPRIGRLAREFQELKLKKSFLEDELVEIALKLQVHAGVKITASHVYPGVTVSIGKCREQIDMPRESFVFEPPKE